MGEVQRFIGRLLRGLLEKAIGAADDDSQALAERVHEIRSALRKARALLRLVRPLLGRRARKDTRRLAAVCRRFGALRDAEVLVETFDRVTGPRWSRSISISTLRARLSARRQRLERRARTTKALRRASKILRAVRGRAKGFLRREPAQRALARRFARGYEQAREAMKEAYRQQTPEAFHAWRKAVKNHAFHVRVLASAGVKEIESHRDLLDALGAALGEAQDLALLDAIVRIEMVSSSFTEFRGCERLLALIEARQRAIRVDARPVGRRLFARLPSSMRRTVEGSWRRDHAMASWLAVSGAAASARSSSRTGHAPDPAASSTSRATPYAVQGRPSMRGSPSDPSAS